MYVMCQVLFAFYGFTPFTVSRPVCLSVRTWSCEQLSHLQYVVWFRYNALQIRYIPMGSSSHCGDVVFFGLFFLDINQPSLPTPFYSVLVSASVFMFFSTVFHSINSLDNSPLSHSVLPVLFLPYWSCLLHISL